jgi:PAT family beta-lactamase induction signal transducer AmpG
VGLGFASGLPLYLTGPTLSAWLKDGGVDLTTIGLLSAVGLPYSLKFLWAPLLDRHRLPWLGRRRGWLLAAQAALVAAIAVMGLLSPERATALSLAAVVVAALSATQDVAVDAYRTDLLPPEERAPGAATYVTGYRVAVLVSGGLALALSDRMSWSAVYLVMAALLLPCLAITVRSPEPPELATPPPSLADAVVTPLRRLSAAPLVLVFAALYKLGEHVTLAMTTPFLQDIGFTNTQVGGWYHVVGLAATIVGLLLGGGLAPRLETGRALLLFGVLQAATNFALVALAMVGPEPWLLAGAVILDNAAGGLATAAFVAYLMSLCDAAHSATEYAILTSVGSLAGRLVAAASGAAAAAVGWPIFFVLTAAIAVPGLLLCRRVAAR